jgi:nitrate reductase NapAB chaperone NapD
LQSFQSETANPEGGKRMPVFSYLAYPEHGEKKQLLKELLALNYCEVTPAKNEDILILLTDTPDEDTEEQLQKQLKAIKSLQSLGMTFGHTDD